MNAKVLVLFGIIVSMALAVNWASSPDTGEASTFNPIQGGVTFSTTATGANPDITTIFDVPPPSANLTGQFGGAITFEDGAVAHHTDAGMLNGSFVGSRFTILRLGVGNGACNSITPVKFDFVEASTGGTIISPAGPSSNLLANLAEDDGDLDNDQQTILTANVSAGATSLPVASSTAFSSGDTIYIGGGVTTTPESVTLAVNPPNATTITVPALAGPHQGTGPAPFPGETVVVPDVTTFAFNGVADGADAYPDFIRDSLDPDGPGGLPPIVPRARYYAMAFVAGSLIFTFQFVVLNPSDGPGGAVDLTDIPGMEWADASWGFPNATFLDMNSLAPPTNNPISHFCNFTSSTALFGVAHDNLCTAAVIPAIPPCTLTGGGFSLRGADDGGCPGSTTPNECNGATRVTNPGVSQTVSWRQWAVSQRDWDQAATPPQAGDGIENSLDPCPTHPAGRGSVDSWDPRASSPPEDTDSDGIPNTSTVDPSGLSCDPTSTSTGFDEDGDGWGNRLDNCPRLANGNFSIGLSAGASSGATSISVTAASGPINPAGFRVGDIISVSEGATSDTGLLLTGVAGTTLGFSGDPLVNSYSTAASVAQQSHAPNTGQFDVDAPVGAADAGPRNDDIGAPCDPNPTEINGHYHATIVVKHICIGTVTSDCSSVTDSDGDGVVNQSDNCIGGANAKITGFAQSQRDLNADGFSDIGDIVLVAAKFGTEGGSPTAPAGYEGRLDLNYDRFVDISDIVLLAGVFGAAC